MTADTVSIVANRSSRVGGRALLLLAFLWSACGGDGGAATSVEPEADPVATTALEATTIGPPDGGEAAGAENGEQRYPDVVRADAAQVGDDWTFSATISSPYDTPQRYADAWRVVAPDGSVLGVRELAHDHAAEQPFTRSLTSIAVPADVDRVTIEARDQTYGWGGTTVEVALVRN